MPGGTTAEREFKMLTSKKESLFTILQTLYDKSKSLKTNADKVNFKMLCKSIINTRNDLINVLEQLNTVGFEIKVDFKPDFSVLKVIDEMYCQIQAAAADLEDEEKMRQINSASNSSSSSGSSTPGSNSVVNKNLASLPKIEIPEFSGEIRQWETFYSIFKSLIHENSSLSNADKVHYLVGRLKGVALSVCAGISPTEDNYTIIWDALVSKYEDKRALASNYLSQLFEFKSLSGESNKNLNYFLERFDTSVRALRKLGLKDFADFILMSLALSKLDKDTVRLFEMEHRASDMPTYEELITFVKSQSKILSLNSGMNKKDIHNVANNTVSNLNFGKPRHNKTFFVGQVEPKDTKHRTVCNYCNKLGHFIGHCDTFKALTPAKRYEKVKNSGWCFNCLSAAHGVRTCPSKRTCAKCDKKHHFLLHLGRITEQIENTVELQHAARRLENDLNDAEDNNNNAGSSHDGNQFQVVHSIYSDSAIRANTTPTGPGTILLATAVVDIVNSAVTNNTARFLIDSGSQVHLLTTKCCKRLGLAVSKFHTSVLGLGSNSYPVKGVTEFIIASKHFPEKKYIIKALLVDKISEKLPTVEIQINQLPELKELQLADENFGNPGEIDGIIGAELFPFILGSHKVICASTPSVVAMETVFGYTMMGKYCEKMPLIKFQAFFVASEDLSLDKLVKRFWEVEQIPQKSNVSPQDIACENIFNNSYSRSSTGRFTVALPFEKSPNNLGDSKSQALLRLHALERKLMRFPIMRLEYHKVMQDFIDQGHMRLVEGDISDIVCYYMPHHAVLKPTSTSTPVRVVLDASAPCDNNVSLNDLLYCGPKLQADIFTLLLLFRQFQVALTADIRQMYRQINILKDHYRFQRLLWRFHPDDKVCTYEITTVAFGVKSSPYLALRTIMQLVKEERLVYPRAAEAVDKCLYMDDFVTSVSTEEEASCLFEETIRLFKAGGFELTKWSTNSEVLLEKIPMEKRLEKDVTFRSDTKILGMKWNPRTDTFRFSLEIPPEICSKRIILSVVARCFDPVGLIAPFILYLKLIIKELWKLKLGWDETPPAPVCKMYSNVRDEWVHLEKLKINRHVGICDGFPVRLVGFADASSVGYGAVVYVCSNHDESKVSVKLLCAKSKVSPMKMVTIPRLELCAALLLSKLLQHVIETYNSRVIFSGIWAFSDSTIVLQWLNTYDIKDIFVANRVTQIRENLTNVHWCHVEGESNPADCLSRGLTPVQLVNHSFWSEGPSWLKNDISKWPVANPIVFPDNRICESIQNGGSVLTAAVKNDNARIQINQMLELINRSSRFWRLLRVTVRVLKFLKILEKGDISVEDMNKAECCLVKVIQREYFSADIVLLKAHKECSNRLRKLRPFIHDGLLRVGGRLSNADLSFQQSHPIILPSKTAFVEMLVDFYHRSNMHAGPYLLEALLRQKYWIVGGRSFIRSRVHKCNQCFRLQPRAQNPMMADLPIQRVQQAKVFCHTGVDYFGPFNLTLGRRKNAVTQKAYVCLFVCMSVKAIHLELASSLSTGHFLQCFKRFLSRRGPCQVLFSDQGTNFVGAKRVLDEIQEFVKSDSFNREINEELIAHGIKWKFNAPSAPHMGGLWESNVKSAKYHLYRVIGKQSLTYEEFNTLLVQVEALLNSRPLCRLGADPSAPEALTPAHFLTLTPLKCFPVNDVTEIPINRLDRYQLIDRMIQDYWKRWHLEYLTTLQVREKWNKPISNIKIGTVVIVRQENSPPLHWPLAIVSQIHPGPDGIVRNVTVKTSKGHLTRPVVKLCPLPTQ